ncbi:hypothetical protein PCE1_000646 [Barthelona sp. PCE]
MDEFHIHDAVAGDSAFSMGFAFLYTDVLPIFSKFSKKWIVVRPELLCIFDDHRDSMPSITIDLATVVVAVPNEGHHGERFVFSLSTSAERKPYYFAFPTRHLLRKWLMRLQKVGDILVPRHAISNSAAKLPHQVFIPDSKVPRLWIAAKPMISNRSLVLQCSEDHITIPLLSSLMEDDIVGEDPPSWLKHHITMRHIDPRSKNGSPTKRFSISFLKKEDHDDFISKLQQDIEQCEQDKRDSILYEVKEESSPKKDVHTQEWFSITHSGYLVKRGGFFPTWKRRFFVLFQGLLMYFATEEEEQPLSVISLKDAEVRPAQKAYKWDENCVIELITPKRMYWLVADNELEKDGWISVLQRVIDGIRLKDAPVRHSSLTPSFEDEDETKEMRMLQIPKMEGYLLKESNHLRNWNQRYVYITSSGCLEYYREKWDPMSLVEGKEEENECLGSVFLGGCRVEPDINELTAPFAFKLYTSKKTFHFACLEPQPLEQWVKKLMLVSKNAKQLRVEEQSTVVRHTGKQISSVAKDFDNEDGL